MMLLLLTCVLSAVSQNLQITTESLKKETKEELSDPKSGIGGSFGAVSFENLTTSGLLKLNGTTVKNILHVDGSLLTQGALLSVVEVCGEANFKNTQISQAIRVIGSLRAEKSTFKGPLTLTGIKAQLIGSQVNGITVTKEPNFRGHQVLELRQKTVVDGPIHFESGRGEVHCYPGCYVLGAITGGKLIKKN